MEDDESGTSEDVNAQDIFIESNQFKRKRRVVQEAVEELNAANDFKPLQALAPRTCSILLAWARTKGS